jgi:hypothetical protein
MKAFSLPPKRTLTKKIAREDPGETPPTLGWLTTSPRSFEHLASSIGGHYGCLFLHGWSSLEASMGDG